eukprot:1139508-Pelagomonas_calceolata.AAC.2
MSGQTTDRLHSNFVQSSIVGPLYGANPAGFQSCRTELESRKSKNEQRLQEEPYKSVCRLPARPLIDRIQVLFEALLLAQPLPNRGLQLAAWACGQRILLLDGCRPELHKVPPHAILLII